MKWVTKMCIGHVLQVGIRRLLHTKRCQGQLEQEAFIAMRFHERYSNTKALT